MSIQTTLNNQAINKLPKITELIKSAAKFEANQMTNRTIRELLSSEVALDNMNDEQLHEFQVDIINIFKHFGWC